MPYYKVDLVVCRRTQIKTWGKTKEDAADFAQSIVGKWDGYTGCDVVGITEIIGQERLMSSNQDTQPMSEQLQS